MLTKKAQPDGRHGSVGTLVLVLLVVGTLGATTLLSGVVTGKTESGIQIDGRTYTLHSKVTVKDEEGEEMSLEDLVPGIEVRFHLKRGKIDQIIMIQPG